MELPSPSHLMILSTLFTVFIFRSSMASAASSLMQDICHSTAKISPKTITYNHCINALKLDPQSARANLKGLAIITLNLAQTNATDSKKFVQNLISKQTDPSVIKSLKNCVSCYDAAKNSFRSALSEIEEDPMTANYDVKIAGDDADQCVEELSKLKTEIPSVTARNKYLKIYSYIGDVITGRLY